MKARSNACICCRVSWSATYSTSQVSTPEHTGRSCRPVFHSRFLTLPYFASRLTPRLPLRLCMTPFTFIHTSQYRAQRHRLEAAVQGRPGRPAARNIRRAGHTRPAGDDATNWDGADRGHEGLECTRCALVTTVTSQVAFVRVHFRVFCAFFLSFLFRV